MNLANLKKIFFTTLKLSIAIALIYFTLNKLDIDKLWHYIKEANLVYLMLALLFSSISLTFSAFRSQLYLKEYGLNLSKQYCIALYFVGTFFNIFLPGGIGGDGYKVYLLWKQKHFPKVTAIRIMLYERVNGFYALAFFGLVLALFSDFLNILPYTRQLAWLCILLITPTYLFGVKYILKDKPSIALKAIPYSFIVQLFQLIMFLCIIFSFKQTLSYQTIINFSVLFVIASIVAIIPISIGGIGLRELTFLYGIGVIDSSKQEIGVAIALLVVLIYILTAIPGAVFTNKIQKLKHA